MQTSRFTDEQIIGVGREYEAGVKLGELCRRHGISQTTFYKWRAKYGESVRLSPSGAAVVASVTLRRQRNAKAAARGSG